MYRFQKEYSHIDTPAAMNASVGRPHPLFEEEHPDRQGSGEGQHLSERREFGLDETLSETFPCSDPLSSIPNPTTPSV